MTPLSSRQKCGQYFGKIINGLYTFTLSKRTCIIVRWSKFSLVCETAVKRYFSLSPIPWRRLENGIDMNTILVSSMSIIHDGLFISKLFIAASTFARCAPIFFEFWESDRFWSRPRIVLTSRLRQNFKNPKSHLKVGFHSVWRTFSFAANRNC